MAEETVIVEEKKDLISLGVRVPCTKVDAPPERDLLK